AKSRTTGNAQVTNCSSSVRLRMSCKPRRKLAFELFVPSQEAAPLDDNRNPGFARLTGATAPRLTTRPAAINRFNFMITPPWNVPGWHGNRMKRKRFAHGVECAENKNRWMNVLLV